jgi:hypothetical protein
MPIQHCLQKANVFQENFKENLLFKGVLPGLILKLNGIPVSCSTLKLVSSITTVAMQPQKTIKAHICFIIVPIFLQYKLKKIFHINKTIRDILMDLHRVISKLKTQRNEVCI